MTSLNELVGKTIQEVDGLFEYSEVVTIRCTDGTSYQLFHEQDCCESVLMEDCDGDETDLVGGVVNSFTEEDGETPNEYTEVLEESFTWTFYKLDTSKGGVTMRWLGESNGYYSESVDFKEI